MQAKVVIDLAPWPAAVGAAMSAASAYTEGPLSTTLNTASLVIQAMTLGALLTHFPGLPSSAARRGTVLRRSDR